MLVRIRLYDYGSTMLSREAVLVVVQYASFLCDIMAVAIFFCGVMDVFQ